MATGETDLEAREEIAGRVLSVWEDLRKWERLLWWKRESAARTVVLREMKRLTAESNVKYSRFCENQQTLSPCGGFLFVVSVAKRRGPARARA